MAYDTIRQFLGQALQQKLLQESPTYKQQILEGELKNKMLAMQMDEEFPLHVAMLQKQLEYMIDPYKKIEAQQAAEFKKMSAIENLRAKHEEALANLRGAWNVKQKQTPSIIYNYGNPDKQNSSEIKTAQSNLRILQSRLKSLKIKKEGYNPATKAFESTYTIPPENVPVAKDIIEQIRLQSELAGMPINTDEYLPMMQSENIPIDNTTTLAQPVEPTPTSTFKWNQ